MIRKRLATWGFSLALTAASAPFISAAAPVIGMASAQSGVTLDNSKVSGTATLFEGSTLQSEGYSRIHLKNGTRLDLAAGSKAQVFANHAALSSGMGEMQSPSGFEIDTPGLKIQSTGADSVARVKIDSDKVYVTALNSPVNVRNSKGMLVAKVAPGMPLSFMAQGAAASNAFDVTDCVLQKNGAAILDDQKGNQLFELRGADFRKAIGDVVRVIGTADATATPAGGAVQVIKVTSYSIVKKNGCATVAKAIGATTTAAGLGAAAASGAGAAAGAAGAAAGAAGAAAGAAGAAAAGIGTTAAVVGGVAAATAAAVGGAAAAGAFTTPSP